jgi:RNA polymerase sigma-70 factor (ECF subfamily)
MKRLIESFRRPRRANVRHDWFAEWPSSNDLMRVQEGLKRMRGALDGVSGRTRAIFLLHRLDGLDYTEIARHMDLTVVAVEKHIACALAVLAEANDQG